LSASSVHNRACLSCSSSKEKSKVLAGLPLKISKRTTNSDVHGASMKLSKKIPKTLKSRLRTSTNLLPL
jgi:hypothetical protein